MKIKREGIYFLIFMVMMLFLFNVPGCKTNSINSNENLNPEGSLLSYMGCKGETASTFQGQDSVKQGETQECIIFEYAGNTLNLKHVNAYLNCCPGEITADILFQGQSIVITEKEAELGCFCTCYYDIDYQINNIGRGTYTIVVKEKNPLVPNPLRRRRLFARRASTHYSNIPTFHHSNCERSELSSI